MGVGARCLVLTWKKRAPVFTTGVESLSALETMTTKRCSHVRLSVQELCTLRSGGQASLCVADEGRHYCSRLPLSPDKISLVHKDFDSLSGKRVCASVSQQFEYASASPSHCGRLVSCVENLICVLHSGNNAVSVGNFPIRPCNPE